MLREFEPLEVRYVEIMKEKIHTKKFFDKLYLVSMLQEQTNFDKDSGILVLPTYDERYLSKPIFEKSKQKRMIPGGFKLIDYEISYSPLGRCIVTLYGSNITRKDSDYRYSNEKRIGDLKLYFVNKESTGRWHLVDLKNEGHETTLLYKELEIREDELVNYFKKINEINFSKLKRMAGLKINFAEKQGVELIFIEFNNYMENWEETLNMYRFFDWISPIEKEYLEKYIYHLLGNFRKYYPRFKEIQNEKEVDMYGSEKELFKEMTLMANDLRLFFIPAQEKNLFEGSISGYCPTKHFLEELKEKRILIPNISEVERRMAFSSEGIFQNEKNEKEVQEKLKNHFFKMHKI